MANIEAIIVDGVRYDKVKTKTDDACDECELIEVCTSVPFVKFAVKCNVITGKNECWKIKE